VHNQIYYFGHRRGGGRMVVSFTNTYEISANDHCSCEFESNAEVCSIYHYVIMFVSNLQQVGGFPPLIKLTATI
jgi:hypothetical protein